jgi:hypothetical protein
VIILIYTKKQGGSKMKKVMRIATIIMMVGLMSALSGCIKPYDEPEYKMIEPHQTGILIPLEGNTEKQGQFMSEEFLKNNKVASKRVQIPHRWLQTGRRGYQGEWIPTMKLIVVDRTPQTREWTESKGTGTSSANQGIRAESKESIDFLARFNVSAQILEEDVAKFLYNYNMKPLSQIMDTDLRAVVEGKFTEEAGKRELKVILEEKEDIMKNVVDYTTKFFKERGITVSVLKLKGSFGYDPAIQKSIDDKFKSAQEVITQQNLNKKAIEKAEADAQVAEKQAMVINTTAKLKELEIREIEAKAMLEMGKNWRPTHIMGDTVPMMQVD